MIQLQCCDKQILYNCKIIIFTYSTKLSFKIITLSTTDKTIIHHVFVNFPLKLNNNTVETLYQDLIMCIYPAIV